MVDAPRLELPDVTLLAVSSVNVDATMAALSACLASIEFSAARLITGRTPKTIPAGIEVITAGPLSSARAYSDFVLQHLADYVETSHCLLVQWDGYALRPEAWNPVFLDYDYIGAGWPQFSDGHDVGNGGFSLRSRALMEACRDPGFRPSHPEDLAIGRENRVWLEGRGLRFAPREMADRFSAERAGNRETSFGFHGVWHMPAILGNEAFFDLYQELDERGSVGHDFQSLLWQVAQGPGGLRRAAQFIRDRIRGFETTGPPSRKATP